MLKYVVIGVAAVTVAFGMGCSSVKNVVVKDIALEDQIALLEKYQGRHAWTRGRIEDLTERVTGNEPRKNVIPRDTKVTVVDINFAYNGAVTVDDPKGKRVVKGLDCERPLTPAAIEKRLSDIFWFEDPTLRHVDYIRKWGKKTARSVMNHEVFPGMPAEAAMESWGIPDEIVESDLGGEKEARWKYKEGKRTKYIFVISGVVGRFEE